jgi:hypothetical protein
MSEQFGQHQEGFGYSKEKLIRIELYHLITSHLFFYDFSPVSHQPSARPQI